MYYSRLFKNPKVPMILTNCTINKVVFHISLYTEAVLFSGNTSDGFIIKNKTDDGNDVSKFHSKLNIFTFSQRYTVVPLLADSWSNAFPGLIK